MNDATTQDSADRAVALDAGRSYIVQAPAGSGKTELLIQRYLALLATVERPESVLAITFTRKAAAEMRKRVLDALRRDQEQTLAAPDSSTADREAPSTLALARAALQADAAHGW